MTPAKAIRDAFGLLKADEGVVVVHAAALLIMTEGLRKPATLNLRGRARKAIRSVAMLKGVAVAADVAKIRAPEKFVVAMLKDFDELVDQKSAEAKAAAKARRDADAETKRNVERNKVATAAAKRAEEEGAKKKAEGTKKKNAEREAAAAKKAKAAKPSPITPKKKTTPEERAARHGKKAAPKKKAAKKAAPKAATPDKPDTDTKKT